MNGVLFERELNCNDYFQLFHRYFDEIFDRSVKRIPAIYPRGGERRRKDVEQMRTRIEREARCSYTAWEVANLLRINVTYI